MQDNTYKYKVTLSKVRDDIPDYMVKVAHFELSEFFSVGRILDEDEKYVEFIQNDNNLTVKLNKVRESNIIYLYEGDNPKTDNRQFFKGYESFWKFDKKKK